MSVHVSVRLSSVHPQQKVFMIRTKFGM